VAAAAAASAAHGNGAGAAAAVGVGDRAIAIDVSGQAQRTAFYMALETVAGGGELAADLWQSLVDGYLDQCGGRVLVPDGELIARQLGSSANTDSAATVGVLLPLGGNLRAVPVPVGADVATIARLAQEFCAAAVGGSGASGEAAAAAALRQAQQTCAAAVAQRLGYVLVAAAAADSGLGTA
jgi:hypothetical protein